MRLRKKRIAVGAMMACVLVGGIVGAVVADTGSGSEAEGPRGLQGFAGTRCGFAQGLVLENLGVERDDVTAAMAQARSELGEDCAGDPECRQAVRSRVLEILGIDEEELEEALEQAKSRMAGRETREARKGGLGLGVVLEDLGVDRDDVKAAWVQARSELGEDCAGDPECRQAVRSRVLEILGMDEEELGEAIEQAKGTMGGERPRSMRFGRGARGFADEE